MDKHREEHCAEVIEQLRRNPHKQGEAMSSKKTKNKKPGSREEIVLLEQALISATGELLRARVEDYIMASLDGDETDTQRTNIECLMVLMLDAKQRKFE